MDDLSAITLDSATAEESIAAGATAMLLHLEVTDPEVVAELRRHAPGPARERFALGALRLGVLSLRMTSGQLDATTIGDAGKQLVSNMRELLNQRATELTADLGGKLQQYFDPQTGALSLRLQSLVHDDGDLARLLKLHLGSDDSVLAKTLTHRLGEGSPIFKMLSPADSDGLQAQLKNLMEKALEEQKRGVVREFSLDDKTSALSRLVEEISTKQGELRTDLKSQIDGVVKEFSLDEENSALSRLVTRVEKVQQAVADQFSTDNEVSAINRMTRLLQTTSDQIGKNLTLDDDQSALARLKRELQKTLDDMAVKNSEFHTQVRETLATLQTAKAAADKSTAHGLTFESRLGDVLMVEAQRASDVYEATGNSVGNVRNCKKGDHVITMGTDSPAAGARIAWEAKESQGFSLKDALDEMEEVRKNRDAQVGVFVFSRRSAPPSLQQFARYGQTLTVVWDAEDSTSDVILKAAYSVAKALVVREQHDTQEAAAAVQAIVEATRSIEKQIKNLDEFETWSGTIVSNGQKIFEKSRKMRDSLKVDVERLDAQIAALKTSAHAG
jgi:uncharacterized protein YeeX (DUF496 family)